MLSLHDAKGRRLNLRLLHSERMPYMAGESGATHAHDLAQHVIYYETGRGRIFLGGAWHEVGPGEFWLIPAGVKHCFEAARRDPHVYREATFELQPHRPLDELVAELAGAGKPWRNPLRPPAAAREDLAGTLAALARVAGHRRSMDGAFEELHLCELVLRLARAHRDGVLVPPDANPAKARHAPLGSAELVEAVRVYLNKNFRRPLAMEELAAFLGRSSSTVAHVFKKATRRSVGEELRYLRVTRAKELLRNSDYPIGRIAELCGFGDAAHFSRVFKQHEKLSPKDYREKL